MSVPGYAPKKANIRAYYALEDVNDGSGNGYNLTNTGTVTFSAAKINNGANFGSSNTTKRLNISNNLGITTQTATFMLWVKNLAEISTGDWGIISHVNNTTKITWQLDYQYNGGTRRLAFTRGTQGGGANVVSYYNVTMCTSDFHNVGMASDGSYIYLIYNGVVRDSDAVSGSGANDWYGNGFEIGCYFNTSGKFASILADECIVWNTLLSSAEMLQVYNMRAKTGGAFLLFL